ncbi:septation protein SepH [Corynebacterium crudilactis]|uniref:DNA-binding protein n=1 Tax=Corynebacterium crudilactis TaxID=1652495 RepID=A0A172QS15_9CORY|nr:septation protein SepH [Corynebacterium crudilactis]ANE03472.1 DNA-binding protein [Corynebacterium crudilactis]
MQEIFLVSGDSTESSLVFKTSEQDGAEEFFIAVTDELHAILAGKARIESVPASQSSPKETPVALEPVAELKEPREEKELDPRISAPLTMSPREIQVRVRAGASIEELAEENGVTEARIEPYAHPVLLERARIADLAKQSHPIRENGPAKLTLWEILATAFATRGHDLTTATWDAYKDATNQWIVRVDWKAGLSDNYAEWTLNMHNTSNPTSDPRTPVAADLIDPEFIQPIRTLTSIGSPQDRYEDETDIFDSVHEVQDRTTAEKKTPQDPSELTNDDTPENKNAEGPRNRRRKAVTPHWEDVLLGVRANTKRPKK